MKAPSRSADSAVILEISRVPVTDSMTASKGLLRKGALATSGSDLGGNRTHYTSVTSAAHPPERTHRDTISASVIRVDKVTGEFTEIGPTVWNGPDVLVEPAVYHGERVTDWMDLAFASNDQLYATTRNKLFKIDTTPGTAGHPDPDCP